MDKLFQVYFEKHVLKGIRTICLSKILLLIYTVKYDKKDGGMGDILAERIRNVLENKKYDKDIYTKSLYIRLKVLKTEEIMLLLCVNKRTAHDYRNTAETILKWMYE